MTNIEKKEKLKELVRKNEVVSIEKYYSTLEEIEDYKSNYKDYMTTAPINVDDELRRLSDADYELCTALLTMLLREDYFDDGSFEERYSNGQVTPVIERMIKLL